MMNEIGSCGLCVDAGELVLCISLRGPRLQVQLTNGRIGFLPHLRQAAHAKLTVNIMSNSMIFLGYPIIVGLYPQ